LIALGNARDELEQAVGDLKTRTRDSAALQQENAELKQLVEDVQKERKEWTEEIRNSLSNTAAHDRVLKELQQMNEEMNELQRRSREELASVSAERDMLKDRAEVLYALLSRPAPVPAHLDPVQMCSFPRHKTKASSRRLWSLGRR
jgi:DNA repair exonuclease SbcCD ATPase subunit